MLRSQTLNLRQEEIKGRLAELQGGEEISDEQRAEMDKLSTEYRNNTVEIRAALITEEAERQANAPMDNKEVERREVDIQPLDWRGHNMIVFLFLLLVEAAKWGVLQTFLLSKSLRHVCSTFSYLVFYFRLGAVQLPRPTLRPPLRGGPGGVAGARCRTVCSTAKNLGCLQRPAVAVAAACRKRAANFSGLFSVCSTLWRVCSTFAAQTLRLNTPIEHREV